MLGGHSGDDIDKGRANSVKVAARFVATAAAKCGVRLARIEGGNLRNAIPRESYAVVGVAKGQETELMAMFESFADEIKAEYHMTEPRMICGFVAAGADRSVDGRGVRCAGHVADGEGVGRNVDQSCIRKGAAAGKCGDNDVSAFVRGQRQGVCDADGGVGIPFGRCRGTECYLRLFGSEAKVRAIHAGLECGLFLEKYPHLEMVSFGPTMRGVHSPDERLEIASVDKFWRLLREVVTAVARE